MSSGNSELLTIPALSAAECSPPAHPRGNIRGSVLAETSSRIILCGGKNDSEFNTECHRLESGSTWEAAPALQTPDRLYAAAISFMGGMWVTGKNVKLSHNATLCDRRQNRIK